MECCNKSNESHNSKEVRQEGKIGHQPVLKPRQLTLLQSFSHPSQPTLALTICPQGCSIKIKTSQAIDDVTQTRGLGACPPPPGKV